ncbi:hypothetical protein NW754_000250 [Fusarium falciforme]|uniref:Infection structure specific protein n=1 Tax=Fusarium falciforme TaxID=195108 RepID=A0A9W8QZZ1_9HYPO|nr:Hypothetical protein NCS54_01089900 [Fusarium falciforme]KAJ4124552.1 hypothetical protein NW754_000250 [Fusarium falciforme]KAJ4181068.1 hypothetical protein NW755_011364 [Fusarium falciforme]KAJ4243788.1 hypothetical protein NW757_011006 [Fusarium falciforme]WAO93354.1 Hypothetical protein NCS54_01089900 [Fusarium falciforme]
MRFYQLLAVATAVAAAPAPEGGLDERDLQECYKVATSMLPKLTAIPTPDATLSSWILQQTNLVTQTEECVIPHVTGDMAKEYSSYASELSSWYGEQVKGYSSLLDACSDVPEIQKQIESITESATMCSSMRWASETGSASSSDSKDSDSKDDDDNAASSAPIKVGMAAAVAAVAGIFVGII